MNIINLITSSDAINLTVKIFLLTCSFLFTLFLLVVFRQVISMNSVINDENDSLTLKLVAFVLLISSISLFLFGLVIL
jgi:hypothetical protein